MNIACTLLCHISLFLFSCIILILILKCIIKLPGEKLMLAGPNNKRTKDIIAYLSNISPIINVVLNRIVILQQSNAQN